LKVREVDISPSVTQNIYIFKKLGERERERERFLAPHYSTPHLLPSTLLPSIMVTEKRHKDIHPLSINFQD
jgi:hypothetical protein